MASLQNATRSAGWRVVMAVFRGFFGRMGKYDPLRDYLKRQRSDEFELTFAEMERTLLAFLPHSAQRPQWWANEVDAAQSHVQREAWRAAGFDAFLIGGKERVRFQRVAPQRGSGEVNFRS